MKRVTMTIVCVKWFEFDTNQNKGYFYNEEEIALKQDLVQF